MEEANMKSYQEWKLLEPYYGRRLGRSGIARPATELSGRRDHESKSSDRQVRKKEEEGARKAISNCWEYSRGGTNSWDAWR
jgi:hypothetical protein